jgi:arCOG00187 universal archaeal metal-binding-domain/4Fe-4S-binding-domain containing ABC transporter, ATP-binding protein
MRLAVLYSGGKDSTFAMYLAQQMGHEIPYAVSMIPEKGESWIFHVPNMDVVPKMADAMGVISITAGTDGTEEGDMEGLRKALSGLDVEGVVTGAVWSDYQWDRINRICDELSLKVISPLWRKDQDTVLNELIDSGIKAMIIGCYAEGFDKSWLGKPIDENAAKDLRKLRDAGGISIIGEGGEYESFTVDSPTYRYPLQILGCEKEWDRNSGTMKILDIGPADQ